jgi:hypothetical protein
MVAIGAEELDLFMPQLVPVAIELAFTLRAGHPENFRHNPVPPNDKLWRFRVQCGQCSIVILIAFTTKITKDTKVLNN